MNFGVPISEYDRIILGASIERNTVHLNSDSPLAYQNYVDQYGDSTNSLLLTTGWNKDTRDSALAPTKGYFTKLQASGSTLDLKYTMLSAQQQYYVPLSRSYTLALNGMVDWGQSYGGKDFPVIKDVYAGGIGSVRGFEGASLGPRDTATGDFLGGARRMVANAQLYLPFPGATKDKTLRWFVFTDAGRVQPGTGLSCTAGQNNEVQDPCGWRYSAGIGLSWQSPLGPLQLSYGHPLNAKSGDDTQSFQFQIGTGF
jgi:outer membrane protein insertion porin family